MFSRARQVIGMVFLGAALWTVDTEAQLTLTVGTVTADVGQRVEVPVLAVSEGEQPTVITLFVDFDDALVAFVEGRAGDAVPPGKFVTFNFNEEDSEVSMIVFGLDRNRIPDGEVFVLEFDVLSGTPDNQVPLDATRASAATAEAEPIQITLIDGMIGLHCPDVAAPGGVSASEDRPDGVLIEWDAATGAIEYLVFRGEMNNPAAALPINEWQPETALLDNTALPPSAGPGMGCRPDGEIVVHTYYYWVKARSRVGCDSGFSAPDTGSRGGPVKAFQEFAAASRASGASAARQDAENVLVVLGALGILVAVGRGNNLRQRDR